MNTYYINFDLKIVKVKPYYYYGPYKGLKSAKFELVILQSILWG